MTSSPTVSSRKCTDSVTPENLGPMGMMNAPGSWTMRRGRQSASGRRLRIAACASNPRRIGSTPSCQSVIVEHEIAEMRMTLEAHAEQILRFALVPVRRVNPLDDAREYLLRKRRAHQHVHPPGSALRRKTRSATATRLAPSSTIRPAKLKLHSSTTRRHTSTSTVRVHVTSLVKVEASKPYCACPGQRPSICSFSSVRFIGVSSRHTRQRPASEDHAAVWERRRRAPAPARRPESAPAGS